MLQLLLPGGAVIYYGDEIGMEHHVMSPSDKIDGQVRLHCNKCDCGKIRIRTMPILLTQYITLLYDHTIIDNR